MASRWTRLLAKAHQISKLHGSEYCKTFAHRIRTEATAENFNELTKQFMHTRRARIYSRYESAREELDYISRAWKNQKTLDADDVKLALINVGRVSTWFWIGKLIALILDENQFL